MYEEVKRPRRRAVFLRIHNYQRGAIAVIFAEQTDRTA